MATATLSTLVSRLEKTAAGILARHPDKPGRGDWKPAAGVFGSDATMERSIKRGAAVLGEGGDKR